MPRIEAFMFCEGLQPLLNGKIAAIGISTSIDLPFKPPTAFTLSAIIEIRDVRANTDVVTTFRVLDPDGELVTEQSYPARFVSDKPGILATDFRNLLIKKLGTYTFEILLDNELVGRRTLDVALQENAQ